MDDVWKQNQMLQEACNDFETSAVQHMEKMAHRLDKQSTPIAGSSAEERVSPIK